MENVRKRVRNKPYKRKTTGPVPKRKPTSRGKTLTTQQAEALRLYFELNNSVTAVAKVMGKPYGTVREWFRTQLMQDEIAKELAKLQEKIGYSLEVSMAEAAEAMDFAKKTNNANALVKAIEHRAKLNGLLIEKHEHLGAAPFSIQVIGLPPTEAKQIEVTPVPQLPSDTSKTVDEMLDI